ncbi:hypothetical protein [Zavarzinia sp.]|uniref:hypothetical protein n=1 Tax=Zavarzinia sp. TaxID=2027920 RepID=UPI003563EAA2
MDKSARVTELIEAWKTYRGGEAEPGRYDTLRQDLYNARNGIGTYPPHLIDADDEIMAAVEHYFLCRGWVGNGHFPAWQVADLVALYDAGKLLHVTPRHNKNKPTTPISLMQVSFQNKGINDGIRDTKVYNIDTPILPRMPPKYY